MAAQSVWLSRHIASVVRIIMNDKLLRTLRAVLRRGLRYHPRFFSKELNKIAKSSFMHIFFEVFALLGCYASWLIVNDISGQPVGPTFRCNAAQEENRTGRLYRNVVKLLPISFHNSYKNIPPANVRMLRHHCNSPRNILLTIRPPWSLVLIVKLRLDSTVIGCPFLERIVEASRASNTIACPLSCVPPVTIRSCPIPSCGTPQAYTQTSLLATVRLKN